MKAIPVVTGTRPWCAWGEDLQEQNRLFLQSLDPTYFSFVGRTHAAQLDEQPNGALDEADRLRAAIALRNAHGQSVESLLAFLAAAAQAPHFPLGWLLRYKPEDLREVLQCIENGRPFPTALRRKPVTWQSLSEAIHGLVSETVRHERSIVPRFAQFWRRLAHQFLTEHVTDEYNSIKHGLRVKPGGFALAIGVETVPGQPAPRENMKLVGSSEYGSSFFAVSRVEGAEKHHLMLSHTSRNWLPGGAHGRP